MHQPQPKGLDMESSKFAHRPQADGMVDSICLRCYLTIAVTMNESDREAQEAEHVCEGIELALLPSPERPEVPQIRQ